MLNARWIAPLEGGLKGMTHILAIRDNMKTGSGSLNGLEHRSDLTSLSRLGRSQNRPVDPFASGHGYAPSRARSAQGGSTTPIRSNQEDVVGEDGLRLPSEKAVHGGTARARVVIERDIACVSQTSWGVWQQGWAPGKMWACINKVGPVGMSGSTHGTVMILSPSEMCNLRRIDRTAVKGVPEGSGGRISAWCAGPQTGILVTPNFEALEQGVSASSAAPEDPLDTAESCGKKAMLVEHRV